MERFFAILGFVVALFIGGVLIGLLFMAVKNRVSAIGLVLRGQEQQLRLNQNFKGTLDSLQRQIDRMQHSENEQASVFERRLSNQAIGFNDRLMKLEKAQPKSRRTKTR